MKNHILLAACRDMEVAKEVSVGGQKRGALSFYLLKTLQQTSRPLSYRELYQRTYAAMKGFQSPQLEVTNPSDVDKLFLHQASIASLPYVTLTYDSTHGGWIINAGAVHGIPSVVRVMKLHDSLSMEFDSLPEELGRRANSIGKAEVVEVLPSVKSG